MDNQDRNTLSKPEEQFFQILFFLSTSKEIYCREGKTNKSIFIFTKVIFFVQVVTIDSGSGQEKKDKHDIEGLTRSLKKLQDEMEKIRYFMSEMASRQGVVKELGE